MWGGENRMKVWREGFVSEGLGLGWLAVEF